VQVTISAAAAFAVTAWTIGAALVALASIWEWHPGYMGLAIMPLGTAAWLQDRMRRESLRLSCREDAAWNLGKEAAVRSIV
jgi:hypothetical protein